MNFDHFDHVNFDHFDCDHFDFDNKFTKFIMMNFV